MDDRLPTELWVAAHLRQCAAKGIPAYVVRKGAPGSGTVMVKVIVKGKGCRLFNQARNGDGTPGWMDIYEGVTIDESRADQHILRATERDPDVWVIEIEDMRGQNPFEGKVF